MNFVICIDIEKSTRFIFFFLLLTPNYYKLVKLIISIFLHKDCVEVEPSIRRRTLLETQLPRIQGKCDEFFLGWLVG